MRKVVSNDLSYSDLLVKIKQQVRSVQAKAALAVNTSLIQLYWNMGEEIAQNQALLEGRNNHVTQLSKDLQLEFPEITGFYVRNLFYIRKFYQFYSDSSVEQLVRLSEMEEKTDSVQQLVAPKENEQTISMQQAVAPGETGLVQQPVGLKSSIYSVPWGHHVLIINKKHDANCGRI